MADDDGDAQDTDDDPHRFSATEVREIRHMLLEYQHRSWAMRQLWIGGGIILSVMTGFAAVYTAVRTFMGIK